MYYDLIQIKIETALKGDGGNLIGYNICIQFPVHFPVLPFRTKRL